MRPGGSGTALLAWLRRVTLGLLKQHQSKKHSLVMKRHMAGWNPAFLAEILFGKTTERALAQRQRGLLNGRTAGIEIVLNLSSAQNKRAGGISSGLALPLRDYSEHRS